MQVLRLLAERASEVDRVLMMGSGDSLFLGHAAVPAFERLTRIPAKAVEAYDLVTARTSVIDPHSLVIGISVSDQALRTVEALGDPRVAAGVGIPRNPASLILGESPGCRTMAVLGQTRSGRPIRLNGRQARSARPRTRL